MKSIVLLLCSLLSYSLIAQPTTLDMKERYYMKGEKNSIQLEGGSNPLMATKDENGNYFYVGSAIFGGEKKAMVTQCRDGVKNTFSLKSSYAYDCLFNDNSDKVIVVTNPAILEISKSEFDKNAINFIQSNASTGIGYQKIVYNPNTDNYISFGAYKIENPMRAAYGVIDAATLKVKETSFMPKSRPYFPNFDGYKIKNDFAAINNNIAIWIYNSQESPTDYSAVIGLSGIFDRAGYAAGGDKIDLQDLLKNFVNDFRPYTSYENKAYEQIYKAQWAISGIHPKEDGTFLITASFIHWATTTSGKAGYQKGILGVEYDFTQSNSITETWVVFPKEIKEATSTQEKMEINPYYTHYIGENDIAVFDQETGNLFAINSDLDACKSTDELGTCAKKSKELQKWLINNRVIAKIEPTGYFLNFVGSNTPHNPNEKKTIRLIQMNDTGSGFRTINFSPSH